MIRPVVFSGDIFRHQARGGITRYFVETARRMVRPWTVVAGVHQSLALDAIGNRTRAALRLPSFRGAARLRAAANACVDRAVLTRQRGVILHPTYYRDPRGLPAREPVVATVVDMTHEMLPAQFRRDWWATADPARHKRALCERADRVVCISEATRRDLIALLHVPESKTRVIHCGSPRWEGVAPRPIAGLDAPFLLWVGERHSYKNFAATLVAWAACREAAGTWLLCLGAGPFTRGERAAIDALGVSARVRHRDAGDDELNWAYATARALLYTSLWEGFGLPLLEAMSLGCPVVTSNRSSMPEVAGEEAIYVDPTDRASIGSGIAGALAGGRDAGAARRMARATHFSWDDCAAAHEAVYAELDS